MRAHLRFPALYRVAFSRPSITRCAKDPQQHDQKTHQQVKPTLTHIDDLAARFVSLRNDGLHEKDTHQGSRVSKGCTLFPSCEMGRPSLPSALYTSGYTFLYIYNTPLIYIQSATARPKTLAPQEFDQGISTPPAISSSKPRSLHCSRRTLPANFPTTFPSTWPIGKNSGLMEVFPN